MKFIHIVLLSLIIFAPASIFCSYKSNDVRIESINSQIRQLENKKSDLKKQLVEAQKQFDSAPYNSAQANDAQNNINSIFAQISDINRQIQRFEGQLNALQNR